MTPMRALVLACLLLAALVAAGCGDDGERRGGSSAASSALPAPIREAGVVKVASDVAYPPLEYFKSDGRTITGFDFDLGQALGERLEVRFQFVNTAFDGIIPALQAGRFDVVMSAMTDNEERQRVLDFVDYLNAGTSILVERGNPHGVAGMEDLCGKTVAAQVGTIHVDAAKEASADCRDAGRAAIDVETFPKDTDAVLQVRNGRAAADLTDSPVAAYTAKNSEDLEVVDAPLYEAEPYGIGVKKGNDQLRDAIRDALQELIDDGTYERLLDRYGMRSGAVERATVNRQGG